jgi:hypothetical protein
MSKVSMLGIIGGAALLAAVPVSLKSQVGSTVPLVTVSQADAQTAGMQRRQTRRTARQAGRQTRRAVAEWNGGTTIGLADRDVRAPGPRHDCATGGSYGKP